MNLLPNEILAVRLSLLVALQAVVVALPLATACAWLLARGRWPGKFLLDGLVHLPLVVPPVVVGYGLLLLFGVHGPVGAWLARSFEIRLAFTTTGASLATGVMAFPLMVRAIRLSVEAIDPQLEDAARTLGASTWDRFLTISLPLMLPGILAGTIIAFAASLGEFGAVITFVGNVEGETQTLPLAIYAALQSPGGERMAGHLALLSIGLALLALFAAEAISQAARQRLFGISRPPTRFTFGF